MSSSGNSQLNNEFPILHIDAATFQAAVTAAAAAALINLNTGNAIVTDKGIENFDCCINPGSQQRAAVMDVQSRKTEKRKRNRRARKERQRSQRLAMRQQQVATPAPSAPAQPISQVPGIGTISAPKGGGKTGPHKRKVSKWMNEEGTRVHITLTKHLTSTTNASASQMCHQCGEIGHLRKDCPIIKNSGADGRILRITATGETTPDLVKNI
ncbi:hypothetical protein Lser_V15G33888 [Lactuca serriola]